jgi:hypothetical protein
MDTPREAPPGAIDRLRAAVKRAIKASGGLSPTDIAKQAIELSLGELPANTLADYLNGTTMVLAWPKLDLLTKVLGAERDENWKELHELAERERNISRQEKRRNARPETTEPAHTMDEESRTPPEPGTEAASTSGLTVPISPSGSSKDNGIGPAQSVVATMTAVLDHDEPKRSDGEKADKRDEEVPPAPLTPKPDLDPPSWGRRHRKALIGAGVAIAVLVVVSVGAIVLLKTHHTTHDVSKGGSMSPSETAIRKGPEISQGTLAWVEAPIDGSMVGQATQMAHTIGLWSQPSQSCDLTALNQCVPGSTASGKVTLPATVRVTCVTSGQKLRNGAPGASGYYEDDRWLLIAPGPGVQGTGYLSNVWFARDKLPPNLVRCPR